MPSLPHNPTKTYSFEALPDVFIHTSANTSPAEIGPVPVRFGLLDSEEGYWKRLDEKIDELEKQSPSASFKLVWAGRHGQGWHNVAESKYGTKAWDEHWAMLNGDDEMTWGPDPELTPLGKDQAKLAQSVWKTELEHGVPIPQSMYSSPFTRALETARITFTDVLSSSYSPSSKHFPPILVVENIREVNGEHTCDKRGLRSYIEAEYVKDASEPRFATEDSLTETDELWTEERERDEHVRERVVDVLRRMFEFDATSRYISITAHSGWITQLLIATGHRKYNLPTGGVIPLLIRATLQK